MSDDTLHDLRVKYDNTFVGLKLPSGTILPFYIDEIFMSDDAMEHEDYDPDDAENVPAEYCSFGGRAWHNPDDFSKPWKMTHIAEDLDFSYPRMGVAEVGVTAIYSSRVANVGSPAKYRKTPTYEGIETSSPSAPELRTAGIYVDQSELIPELLFHAWNDQPYRSIEEATDLLTTGKRLGCSLSPIYSLHMTSLDDNLRIAREGMYIGSYVPELKLVYLNNENLIVYFEELAELGFEVNKEEFTNEPISSGSTRSLMDDIIGGAINANSVWDTIHTTNLIMEIDPPTTFTLESMEN